MISLAAVALAATLSSVAVADSMPTYKGLYASGALGGNWLDDYDVDGFVPPGTDVKFDNGYLGAAAVGYAGDGALVGPAPTKIFEAVG